MCSGVEAVSSESAASMDSSAFMRTNSVNKVRISLKIADFSTPDVGINVTYQAF